MITEGYVRKGGVNIKQQTLKPPAQIVKKNK